jgi:hypothetical protein
MSGKMPRNVKLFAWLYAASCAIGLVGALLMPPPPAGSEITRPVELAVTMGFAILMILIELPFVWLVVWKRKNWARWLLLVLFVITLPLLFVPYPPEANFLPMIEVAVGATLIQAIAFYFVFTGDARRWFVSENSN